MSKYIALGTNLGQRKENLEKAIDKISSLCHIKKLSPIYETAALLTNKNQNGSDWNLPYLNMVIEIESNQSPTQFLKNLQCIEKHLGRTKKGDHSPRLIDLDILTWDQQVIATDELNIPHPELENRAFVLDPLKDIDANYIHQSRSHPKHAPLWMGIINLSQDSFSDGGQISNIDGFEKRIVHWQNSGVHIVDIGAQSTRPNAVRIGNEEEWRVLEPYLEFLGEKLQTTSLIKTLISIDTYNAATAEKAIHLGADIINDVSGLKDKKMLSLLKDSDVSYVLTHSLDAPVNSRNILSGDVISQINNWLEEKLDLFAKHHISLNRIFFDPGIGFGKSPLQSIRILKNLSLFQKLPIRLLIGHSRKSFMRNFSSENPFQRDFESIGISLQLIYQGVDVLRVHNPESHIKAHRGFSHVAS